jgi:hypothetical protein
MADGIERGLRSGFLPEGVQRSPEDRADAPQHRELPDAVFDTLSGGRRSAAPGAKTIQDVVRKAETYLATEKGAAELKKFLGAPA